MTDIVERLRKYQQAWTSRLDPPPHFNAIGASFGEAADEIERLRAGLRGAATVVRASADEIVRLRAAMTGSSDIPDRLIDALAECIVARQGLPNRDRAKLVLAEIEAQGWRLVPPKENDA